MKVSESSITSDVYKAVRKASFQTGVPFSYLMSKAQIESSLNPTSKNTTSSAAGLFQFNRATWLEVVKRYGEQYDLDTEGKSGAEILEMRYQPEASAFMAGALANENAGIIEKKIDRAPQTHELYLAHFLGVGGALKFLNSVTRTPDALAHEVFPREAKANPAVFNNLSTNTPRTLGEVENFMKDKLEHCMANYYRPYHNKDYPHDVASSAAVNALQHSVRSISNDTFSVLKERNFFDTKYADNLKPFILDIIVDALSVASFGNNDPDWG